MNDFFERLKWGEPALYQTLLFWFALGTITLAILYWQNTLIIQDLREENDTLLADNETLRQDLAELVDELPAANTRIGELEEELVTVTQERDDAIAKLATVTTERDDANTRIGELEEERDTLLADNETLRQGLADANERISELEEGLATAIAERDTAIQERDDALAQLADAKTGIGEMKDDLVVANIQIGELDEDLATANTRLSELEAALAVWSQQMEIVNGERPANEIYPIAILLGERINRQVPNPDVYESTGIVTLSRGVWAFAVRGLGGDTRTGAGNHKLELNPVSVNCWQEAAGRWDRAYEVTCDSLQVGWEIESRYPYAGFAVLPIDELIPQEVESE
ncbi:MAG: hypothetical protein OXF22_04755 [Anaerolineaceae bacterium]|nr:hypothetical protein [Anaerolineaceae bacterium]